MLTATKDAQTGGLDQYNRLVVQHVPIPPSGGVLIQPWDHIYILR